MPEVPSHARVVIIGGGICGASTAYHLAGLGLTDVVVLEKARITSGSTWHAAGLVGQLRSSANITQLLKYSVELYDKLEEETGQATGWKMCGGLRLAGTEERMTELRRAATTARSFGLEMELLSPREARELWPLMEIDDLVGAAFLPTDGSASPSDTTMALVRGARARGVRFIEGCKVQDILVERGRVTAVDTELGRIQCEILVNCAGQWAREIGALAGVPVPVCSMEHQYMISEPIAGVHPDLPTLRDPDKLVYFKEEVGGLCMGGYEPDPIPWAVKGLPEEFAFKLLPENFDHFEGLVDLALERVPALGEAEVRSLINGPEAFTPDGNFILGEAPEVKNFYVGAGFNAYGIAAAGGAGRALAEWIEAGVPPMDLWPVDIRRFHRHHADADWVRARTVEIYAKHYTMSWPKEEHSSARPRRTSPLFQRLADQGAVFGEKMGWERPNWFAGEGEERKDRYSFTRPSWWKAVGREHNNTRERVSLFDQTSFAKFMVSGTGAEEALSWICANDIRKPPGTLIYTQLLNERGGIECDLTVARLAQDRFYIITGTGFATHDFHWIRSLLPEDGDVELTDITEDFTVLSLMGPRARDLLQSLCTEDMGNEAFGFATTRDIRVQGIPVKALRITYVGELGWELHVATDRALELYDLLMAEGAAFGIANAGYRAIESLRLEKGYRAWPGEVGPDHTPLEAGLGWAAKLRTDIPFLGREALEKQKAEGLTKRLACFTVDDPDTVLWGRETILRDGEVVGWLSSAGWGYTVGQYIGYGFVRRPEGLNKAWLESGVYELEVATRRVPAQLHFGPLVDPRGLKIRS
jgi:4-methylaminobutanoate oxidase (formaldehyde-forming)